MPVKSNFKQAAEGFEDDIEAFLQDALVKTARRAAILGEGFLKKKAREEEIFDTGKFIAGMISDVKVGKDTITLTIDNLTPYAEFIEFGRGPGSFPPLDELVGWVARKTGLPGKTLSYDSLKAKARGGDKQARELAQAVFLIGRAIARKGTKARRFFSRHEEDIENIWLDEVLREFL